MQAGLSIFIINPFYTLVAHKGNSVDSYSWKITSCLIGKDLILTDPMECQDATPHGKIIFRRITVPKRLVNRFWHQLSFTNLFYTSGISFGLPWRLKTTRSSCALEVSLILAWGTSPASWRSTSSSNQWGLPKRQTCESNSVYCCLFDWFNRWSISA